MPFEGDELYKGYVRKNMSRFATKVKVREILPHLPCLSQTDREEVEAKREMTGNYNAMQLLLDNLKRRENWPEEFIRALQECEHPELAQEMRDAYEALKSTANVKPKLVADSSGAVITAHVHPPPPAVSVPAQPPAPASSPSAAAAEPDESAPVPSSPAKTSLPPSGTTEPPFPAKAAPETLVTPDATSQPAPPPDVAPEAESPPSSPAAPAPESTPLTGTDIPEVSQTEEAQAPEVSVPSGPDVPDGPTHSFIPPAEVSEPSSLSLDPQHPTEETTGVSPELTKAPIQETSTPSGTVNLLQEPEETSDPTMHQISTEQRVAAPPEDQEVQPPPPDMQNITPSAPAPVPVPVLAMVHQPSPSQVGSDMEEQEESLAKPEVLQTVTEGSLPSQESVTETQPPELSLLTSSDLKIGTPAGDLVSEANSEVSPRANTDENPEPVPQPETIPILTEANHTQEPVTVKENCSPSHQPNGLSDNRAPSPHHAPTEEHSVSLCSSSLSSQEQSTLVHSMVVHDAQDSSIQNQDGQEQSLMGDVVSSEDTAMVNHSDTQTEVSLTEPTTNHHSLTPSTVGNEVHLSPVKEKALGDEHTSCTKTEVILQAREREAPEEENKHQENVSSGEEEQSPSALASLLPALQNAPLIPAAAAVGVCALVFAWKLRN